MLSSEQLLRASADPLKHSRSMTSRDGALPLPPEDVTGDRQNSWRKAAEAPENFYRQSAERSIMQRLEGVGNLIPDAGGPNVYRALENSCLRVKRHGRAKIPHERRVGSRVCRKR
jgi:hypothetical protein